jgi:putative hemolysin
MSKLYLTTIILMIGMILLSGCGGRWGKATPTPFIEWEENEEGDPFIGIPNPASFYCQEMGYLVEMRETDEGTQGVCIFPDGKECEEWDFLAGRCAIEWSYCQRQGYTIQEDENENTAICNFPDGSSCPEYDFFIKECSPPE